MPTEQSELAQQILKEPYTFDYLSLAPEMLERGLIEHFRALILELGKGFAFVGANIISRLVARTTMSTFSFITCGYAAS